MKYKLFNPLNLFKAKQRKFVSRMNRRWKLIFSHPLTIVAGRDDYWAKLEYQFTPNIPANVQEEAQTAAQLSGIVSHLTQLQYFSIVDNAQTELERIEKENEPEDLLDFDIHKEEETNEQ